MRHWPLLGWLVAGGGTLFIERERGAMRCAWCTRWPRRCARGEIVAVFPEGTTSDGRGLLPFHANLLQAAIAAGRRCSRSRLRYADAAHAVQRGRRFTSARRRCCESVWRVACADGLVAHVTALPR